MTFADKIKLCRERCSLTQQQLADKVGISKRSIAAYESGGGKARRSTIGKLARALNVSYDYLINDNITDPEHGIEKTICIEATREQWGNQAAEEIDELLERNIALLAGGMISAEAKGAFFRAITNAYTMCKEEAQNKYGRKN